MSILTIILLCLCIIWYIYTGIISLQYLSDLNNENVMKSRKVIYVIFWPVMHIIDLIKNAAGGRSP